MIYDEELVGKEMRIKGTQWKRIKILRVLTVQTLIK